MGFQLHRLDAAISRPCHPCSLLEPVFKALCKFHFHLVKRKAEKQIDLPSTGVLPGCPHQPGLAWLNSGSGTLTVLSPKGVAGSQTPGSQAAVTCRLPPPIWHAGGQQEQQWRTGTSPVAAPVTQCFLPSACREKNRRQRPAEFSKGRGTQDQRCQERPPGPFSKPKT